LDVIIISSARRDQVNAMMEQTTGDKSSMEKPNSNCQMKGKYYHILDQYLSRSYKAVIVPLQQQKYLLMYCIYHLDGLWSMDSDSNCLYNKY
jgi:hypothetical protein